MINFKIEVKGLDEVIALFEKFLSIVRRYLNAAMSSSVQVVKGGVKEEAPVYRGILRNLIGSEIEQRDTLSIIGKIGSTLKDEEYPSVMEFGRAPGSTPPPLEPIIRWVHLKRLTGSYSVKTHRRMGKKTDVQWEDYVSAVFIARKIGEVGIRGRHYFQRGLEKTKAKVIDFFVQARDKIVNEMNSR